MNIEEIIIDKIDEINEEYNVIVRNIPDNGYKLENINILSHQKEAMNKVLNELLIEVNNQPDYKSDIELFNLANKTLKDENNNLNKGIDELINEYNNNLINCTMFPKIGDNKVIGYVLDKIIQDLKEN